MLNPLYRRLLSDHVADTTIHGAGQHGTLRASTQIVLADVFAIAAAAPFENFFGKRAASRALKLQRLATKVSRNESTGEGSHRLLVRYLKSPVCELFYLLRTLTA